MRQISPGNWERGSVSREGCSEFTPAHLARWCATKLNTFIRQLSADMTCCRNGIGKAGHRKHCDLNNRTHPSVPCTTGIYFN